jgi:DNA-binding transcriptional ArsR family regulator
MKNIDKQQIIATLANCEDIKDSAFYLEELLQIKSKINQDSKKVLLIEFLGVLGNADRFLILESLKQKDRCVCELEAIVDKSQPAVSHHLKLLEEMNLIRGWKKGKFTHYSIVQKTLVEFELLLKEWCGEITNWFGT